MSAHARQPTEGRGRSAGAQGVVTVVHSRVRALAEQVCSRPDHVLYRPTPSPLVDELVGRLRWRFRSGSHDWWLATGDNDDHTGRCDGADSWDA
jgi:hypothetical protein